MEDKKLLDAFYEGENENLSATILKKKLCKNSMSRKLTSNHKRRFVLFNKAALSDGQ